MIRVASAVFLIAFLSGSAFAGGPLHVGSPNLGLDGQPMAWAGGVVNYRVDGGNFAQGSTVLPNSTGTSRVQAMFNVWASVPTASIRPTNIGPIQPTGAFVDGDVSTLGELDAVLGSCDAGTQTPVIFDANGSMFQTLFEDPSVVGIASPCHEDSSGHIVSGFAMLNGAFQNGTNTSTDWEIPAALFDEAITHEIGHLLGLDHSQINVELKNASGNCDLETQAGLPLMFPFIVCNPRETVGLPKLSPDDIAWISKLYPSASFNSSYGFIRGHIYFTDGASGVQGVNVIARNVSDPKGKAFSVVSGFLFTNNVGQSVTGTNDTGSDYGSREANYEGYYEIAVPPGDYTIEVESIDQGFAGGSSVGPLRTPVPNPGMNEFWDDQESEYDDPHQKTPVTVVPGSPASDKDIILNGTPSRFDIYEEESTLVLPFAQGSKEEKA